MMTILSGVLDTLKDIDTQALLALNGQYSDLMDQFWYVYTDKLTWALLYVSLLWVLLKNLSKRQLLLAAVFIGLTILLADQTSSSLIRHQVARLRPANLDNPISSLVHIVNGYRGGAYGFPSSHAANTFALTAFLGTLMRRRSITWLLLVWSVLNCYSRIYLGVHYPGDILMGALLGSLVGLLSCWLYYKACDRAGLDRFQPIAVGVRLPLLAFLLTVAAILAWSVVHVLVFSVA